MAEWSAGQTRNAAVLGSSPAPSDRYLDLFLGSPKFKL